MSEKENQLWKTFEQMAEEQYYGYIPTIIEYDKSVLAENLKGLINDLADWRRNTVLALTRCPYFERVDLIKVGHYDGTVEFWLREGWIEASLTVSKGHIALWAHIGGRIVVNRVITFAEGDLRRFCEDAGIAPRLEGIIWKNMHRLVAKVDCMSRLLDEQKDDNRSIALQQGEIS